MKCSLGRYKSGTTINRNGFRVALVDSNQVKEPMIILILEIIKKPHVKDGFTWLMPFLRETSRWSFRSI